jgi:spheroidene monooxygenase
MRQYAHKGAHQVASAAAHKHQFFSESLFVRMQVLQMAGVWQGKPFHMQSARPLGKAPTLQSASTLVMPTPEASHV